MFTCLLMELRYLKITTHSQHHLEQTAADQIRYRVETNGNFLIKCTNMERDKQVLLSTSF